MGLALALALSISILIAVFAAAASSASHGRARSKLAAIAAQLAGTSEGHLARGAYHGMPVTYRFETRGAGSTSEAWTEVEVEIPQAYPLTMHIRRQRRRDHGPISRGEMIDVQVGDPVFDPMFLVEAAPADVARILLDPEARGYLASHSEVELDTIVANGGARVLRLSLRAWFEEPPEAMTAIAAVVRIASRVREAFAIAEAALQPTDRGSPYRPLLDDSPVRDAAAARTREVAELDSLRARRIADARAAGQAIAWVMVLVFGAMILAAISGR